VGWADWCVTSRPADYTLGARRFRAATSTRVNCQIIGPLWSTPASIFLRHIRGDGSARGGVNGKSARCAALRRLALGWDASSVGLSSRRVALCNWRRCCSCRRRQRRLARRASWLGQVPRLLTKRHECEPSNTLKGRSSCEVVGVVERPRVIVSAPLLVARSRAAEGLVAAETAR